MRTFWSGSISGAYSKPVQYFEDINCC
uniref:Uncharacterized protein n=1 Tax=Arundo donax TaxID=35708 RepID=A0A0A8ZFZ6_ARUDO